MDGPYAQRTYLPAHYTKSVTPLWTLLGRNLWDPNIVKMPEFTRARYISKSSDNWQVSLIPSKLRILQNIVESMSKKTTTGIYCNSITLFINNTSEIETISTIFAPFSLELSSLPESQKWVWDKKNVKLNLRFFTSLNYWLDFSSQELLIYDLSVTDNLKLLGMCSFLCPSVRCTQPNSLTVQGTACCC